MEGKVPNTQPMPYTIYYIAALRDEKCWALFSRNEANTFLSNGQRSTYKHCCEETFCEENTEWYGLFGWHGASDLCSVSILIFSISSLLLNLVVYLFVGFKCYIERFE